MAEMNRDIDKKIARAVVDAYLKKCAEKDSKELVPEEYKTIYDDTFIEHAPELLASRTVRE